MHIERNLLKKYKRESYKNVKFVHKMLFLFLMFQFVDIFIVISNRI